jgi:hypothetical protein
MSQVDGAEVEAEKTKQIIHQNNFEEEKYQYLSHMDTPVKNERPREVNTPKIRSGTGM